MARLEDESLVLSCPACGAFAQVRSGDADSVCWQCRARLLVRLSGGQVKLVVGPPPAEPAPRPEATGDGPPPLPTEAEQAAWPAGAVPSRRAPGFPPIAWVTIAIMAAFSALMFVHEFVVPGSASVLRTQDGRIEIELPAGWSEALIRRPPCQISATNLFGAGKVCVMSQPKAGFRGLRSYGEIVKRSMLRRLGDSAASGTETIQVNGRPALRYEITGTARLGIRFGYVVTIVETETRFNQVLGYTFESLLPASRTQLAAAANGLHEVVPAAR
jgi:hypothetical protein